MKKVNLTPLEQQILDRSKKPEITCRRRTMVVVSGVSFAAVLVAVSLIKQSWEYTLVIALLYIAMTVFEKVAYANAVLVYKSLIRKLKEQVDAKECDEKSQEGRVP